MKYYQIGPSLLIGLQILTALGYGVHEDYRRVAYWIAGAVITWSVTW
jgi:hypothetical protein